jgi:hypothetical protein
MFQKGDQVLARREGGDRWYKGIIRFLKGENIYVEFEDGVFELATEVRPLSAPPEPPPPEEPQYATGDRVLGRWLDLWWYPATVLFREAGRYHVQFDDGDRGALLDSQVMPLRVEVGDEVQCRPKEELRLVYRPGRISRVAREILDVEFEEGDVETNTSISRVRLWRCPAPVEDFPFTEGDRVLAQAGDARWYPADILTVHGDRITLQYLAGAQGFVTPELIEPLEIREGLRVEGRWRGGDTYFPGEIDQARGERIHIRYDDGNEEWTTIRLIRIPPEEEPPPPAGAPGEPGAGAGAWQVGDRVLAHWSRNGLWYAGTVRGADGDAYHVVFDDGDQTWVQADELTALELPPGTPVLAPRPGRLGYCPAEVRNFDGARVRLRYDDGVEESVALRSICLDREGPG